jgi:hypothetical protein
VFSGFRTKRLDMWNHLVSSRQLADIWKVDITRISQLVRDGKIRRQANGLFDLDECLAYRKAAMDNHSVEMMFQNVGANGGTQPPKVFDHLADSDEDYDPLDLDTKPEPSSDNKTVMTVALAKHAKLTELKAKEQQWRLDRMMTKARREDGELIERKEVYRIARLATGEMNAMLSNLEHEIPALITDPVLRAEVRDKVRRTLHRSMDALSERLQRFLVEDQDEPPEEDDFDPLA